MRFDSEGMGSGVRAACALLNQGRTAPIADEPFAASGSVVDPEGESMAPGRTHADLFMNAKSQWWWALRLKFQQTFRCVAEGAPVADPELIISLDPNLPELDELLRELSQPQYEITPSGKIQVDKAPPGTRSPNRADSIAMLFAPRAGETSYFSALLQGESKTTEEADSPGIVIPGRPGCIVASLCAGLPPFEDTVAVAYLAWCDLVLPDSPLVAIDWHLEELGGEGFTTLIPRVLARLRELVKEMIPLQPGGLILIDSGGVGVQLYCDGCDRGIEGLILLDENIAALDLTARAISASGHVLRGRVKASVAAAEKTATLKAATKNWLLPIMNFSARSPESAGPLLAPIANIVLDTFIDDKRTLAPKMRAIS
jgi:hypothetical protein